MTDELILWRKTKEQLSCHWSGLKGGRATAVFVVVVVCFLFFSFVGLCFGGILRLADRLNKLKINNFLIALFVLFTYILTETKAG